MNKLNNKMPAGAAGPVRQMTLLSLGLLAGLAQAQSALEAGAIAGQTGGAIVAQAEQAKTKAKKTAPKKAAPAATAAAAPKARTMEGPNCSGDAILPQKLVLPLGKSTLVHLPEAVANRAIGNPDIVKAMLMSPQTLYLLGVDIGMTNMIIQGKSGNCTAIDVVVSMDPGGLQNTLAQLMPEEKNIKVSAAADTLVMTGSVEDATSVSRAMELANAFVRRPATAVQSGAPDGDAKASGARSPGATSGGQPRVVNLLNVSAPQQVMLEVKVAEVSKTLLDKLGVGATLRTTSGSWAYTLLSNFLTGTAGGLLDATKTNGSQITLEAEKRDGLVKILAEPTVMAISGQEGSFLAGGKILIPVGQNNNNGTATITLEEKEFGVGLKFTPTVLAGGRINLRVAPEVSELSREGVGITAAGITGTSILPLITTRRAATTVQLFDGQSFAIGGLIKNNTTANIKGLPILGEVPVLGALFRSTDFQQDKTELLFVVTPRLVKPLPPNYALPTDAVADPSRAELFLGGRLEGSNPPAPAAPLIERNAERNPERNPPPAGPGGFELK